MYSPRRPSLLRELQSAFADALIDSGADATMVNATIRGGALPAARRLEIYRHNVLSNLRGALADIYPVVQGIVGEAFFRHAADQFIRANPSRSGDLNQFGQAWAEFLVTYSHAQELPYLADVARLEWAWHESFHAAEHPAFDLARLAAVPAERHGQLRLHLHSSVRLISSAFPLYRIWEVNQPEYEGMPEVDWSCGGDYLLIQRLGVDVMIQQLEEARHQFLAALTVGADLERAAEQALDANSSFDLQGFLLESVQSGVIVNFTLEKP